MNRIATIIARGAGRLNIRPLQAVKPEASKRWASLRDALQHREPRAPKRYILPARAVVVLASLVFTVNGGYWLAAGFAAGSLILILLGVLIVPPALRLGWSALKPAHEGRCSAPVAFAAELLYRIIG